MAKTDTVKRRKKQSKVVPKKAVEEEDNAETEGPMETESSNEQAVENEQEAPSTESTEVKQHEDVNQDKQDSQADAVIEVKGNKSSVTVSWDNKDEDPQENEDTEEKTNGGEQVTLTKTAVKRKRKAQSSTTTTSPPKKTKHNSDGFYVFVGNLDTSKKFGELKEALGNYLMAQCLLIQDIILDRSKKYARINLTSEMDVTAALTLNGELVLDKPIKVAKTKIKSEDDVQVKVSAQEQKAMTDAKCLFLKNLPFNVTKEDIKNIFKKAVDVRFPGGSTSPTKGIAFLEFKNKTIAQKVQKNKQGVKIQDRVLIVDFVGERRSKVTKVDDNDNEEAPPKDTLFVTNLSQNINRQKLKKLFPKAVGINIPKINGAPRGFAFIKFATVADAEKAFGSSQSIKMGKRKVKVLFSEAKETPVLLNTLIVMGLAEKTSAETLKDAFEGALSTRVITDKDTGVSKGYGFVEFESEEKCKAVKDDMEDCEIDGRKVTVAFAKQKVKKSPPVAIKSPEVPAHAQAADQKAVTGRKGSKGGKGQRAGKSKDAVKKVGNKG